MNDFPNTEPLVRKDDPITSHISADELTASGKRSRQKMIVLDALRRFPGSTSQELAMKSGLNNDMVHKRLPDLRRDNFACNGDPRRCKVTHKLALTWIDL